MGSIAGLAGRRIDAVDATNKQFPLENVSRVFDSIKALLVREAITTLVCSAACGADLLALRAALDLGIRYKIILPFEPKTFKLLSVIDRPGDWGPLFDLIISGVQMPEDLIILGQDTDKPDAAYSKATQAIIQEVTDISLRTGSAPIAIAVWEGAARIAGDATQEFRELANEAGFREEQVLTLW